MSDVTPALQVSIKFPKDALDLSETDEKMYAALGYFTTQCAGLENILDKFIFTYGKLKTPLARGTRIFPVNMKEKTEFLIKAYLENRNLRTCGDADDKINLNSIGYLMDEVWEARNHLIHGRLYLSRHKDGDFSFNSTRYTRVIRNEYEEVAYKISRSAIVHLLGGISYLKAFLRTGLEILDGGYPKKEADEIRRNQAAFRERRRNLLDEGRHIDTGGLMRFFAGDT
ncbi:hypothetical protein [Shinella oryzae]|uniref:hypothetical protein n=1 Tax=Shinella oryzae TaxID=2871820 RepID=UPI001FF330AF|nr:hypothetical protein [Shinella oryzae]UPA23725.1 hypothetical protein K6301_11070 [Shinella oryzae]